MSTLLQSISWLDVIAGILLSSLVTAIGFVIRSLILRAEAKRTILRYGKGIWFSAEYDTKGNVSKEHRCTYLRVRMKPTWRGRVQIQSLEHLDLNPNRIETGWKGEGRIENGCLIGEYKSTVKGTLRIGVGMLRFLDNGRAVGYWIGVHGFDSPMYGYWIMSKDEEDLRSIITGAVPPGRFEMIDVARLVTNYERGTWGSII